MEEANKPTAKTETVGCIVCGGRGELPFSHDECPSCHGTGYIEAQPAVRKFDRLQLVELADMISGGDTCMVRFGYSGDYESLNQDQTLELLIRLTQEKNLLQEET